MISDHYNPSAPDENDLINEYARSSLEDWHNEEWAEKDKASARRCVAKIKAEAWDEGLGHALKNHGGKYSDNPYREQEESDD